FLALLAVALGTASLLAYRSAQQALEKKKETAEELVRAQYRERHDQAIARLDEALLHQAEKLAELVTIQTDWARGRFPFTWGWVHRDRNDRNAPEPEFKPVTPDMHLVGIVGNAPTLAGWVPALGWFAETNPQLSVPDQFRDVNAVKLSPNQ